MSMILTVLLQEFVTYARACACVMVIALLLFSRSHREMAATAKRCKRNGEINIAISPFKRIEGEPMLLGNRRPVYDLVLTFRNGMQ
jgi:uncharacterized membrane protein YwaF